MVMHASQAIALFVHDDVESGEHDEQESASRRRRQPRKRIALLGYHRAERGRWLLFETCLAAKSRGAGAPSNLNPLA
jgi:hypothetical protein